MSKEAIKLACKALRDCHYYMINAGLPNQSLLNEAFTAYMELEAALAKQPAQQEPLTYVDLRRIANQCGLGANEVSARTQATVDNFARAIEAAHGIKGDA
jgi:hypothetical protein